MNVEQPSRCRIRKRLIVVVLLWLISVLAALGTIGYLAIVSWTNVELQWKHPNAELLERIREQQLSPPAVATVLCLPFIAFFAASCARACNAGRWRAFIRLGIVLVLFCLLAGYFSPRE